MTERSVTFRGVGAQCVGRLYLRSVGGRWVVLFVSSGHEREIAVADSPREGAQRFESARHRIARALGGR